MALVKGTSYEAIFYEFVLANIEDIFQTEFPKAKIYIGPNIIHPDSFQVRIWGTEATTEDWGAEYWKKRYSVNIYLYLLESNPNEQFYKQLYSDAEKAYQLLYNNASKSAALSGETFNWLDGIPDAMIINDFEEGEEDIDGLNVARLEFNCVVERADN